MKTVSLGPDDLPEIHSRLERAISRGCPPRLASQRQDLLQQALERVARQFAAAPDKRLNATYLKRVAFTVICDAARRNEPEVSELAEQVPAAATDDPESRLHAQRVGRAIVDCLEAVQPSRRAALGLYLQGATLAQAAVALQEPKKRVENFIYRGLAQLRECLEHKGVTP